MYDPFVCRGLDALIYGLYNGARFIVAGTPAGITLAPEGGAHQSTITASIGIELPGISLVEPAYAEALDWLLCDGLHNLSRTEGESLYLRLSTRPIDQQPFAELGSVSAPSSFEPKSSRVATGSSNRPATRRSSSPHQVPSFQRRSRRHTSSTLKASPRWCWT